MTAAYQKEWRAKNKDRALASARIYRDANRGKIRALNRKWAKANPDAMLRAGKKYLASPHGKAARLLIGAKRRSKKLRVPFDLKESDILLPLELGVCEATGIAFCMPGAPGERSPFAPSLDRIKPAHGYVSGNVRVVVWALNAACGEWGEEILWQIVKARWPERLLEKLA